MDPVSAAGLAASVAGLIQLSGQLLVMLNDYVAAAIGAADSVQRLRQELTAITEVLNEISGLLMGRAVTFNLGVTFVLKECEKTLKNILEGLNDFKLTMTTSVSGLCIRQKLKWPFREKKIREWIQILERQKSTIGLQLNAITVAGVATVDSRVEGLALAQIAVECEKKRQKLRKWLSPLPYNSKQSQISDRRQENTGDWLFQIRAYSRWETRQVNALWIYGIPGSGKTYLASKVIDRLSSAHMTSGHHALAYCYCDFTENASTLPVNIIRTFIVQLLALVIWDVNSPNQFKDVLTMMELGQAPPVSIPTLVRLTKRCLDMVPQQPFLVIDALDECTNREDLLQFIGAITKHNKASVLVTSRHLQDITESLTPIFSTINLATESINLRNDMQQYLIAELSTAKWRHLNLLENSAMKTELVTTLLKDSEGNMFRWLQCQLDTLVKHINNKSLSEALRNLPADLFRSYERILLDIIPERRELAYKTLLWLATSTRRMRLNELVAALAIAEGQNTLDHSATVNDGRHLVQICGSLVEYNENDNLINLTHATVKDFLHWDGLKSNPQLSFYFLEQENATSELAKLTLTYLLLDDFATGPCKSLEGYTSRISTYPLYLYSVQTCSTYVRARDDESVFELWWTLFFERLPQYRSFQQALHYSWTRNWRLFQRDYWTLVQQAEPMFYAVDHVMPWVAQRIVKKRPELLEKELASPGTPLILATWQKKYTMVKLFLSLGADPNVYANAPDRLRRTPLLLAAHNGGDEAFDLLLNCGADVNARSATGMHAIHEAAQSSESFGIFSRLLEMDIPGAASLTCGQGSTPLHYAVTGGTSCLPQVKLLVEPPHCANLFAYNNVSETPFHIALTLRSIPVLNYLMSRTNDLSPLGDNEASLLTLEDVQWAKDMPWYRKLRKALKAKSRKQEEVISLLQLLKLRVSMAKQLHLPGPVIGSIIDYAELWAKKTVARHQRVALTQDDDNEPYLSITIRRPLRRVVCKIRSHDQGWSDKPQYHGTYKQSETWFEARIHTGRPVEKPVEPLLLQSNVHASNEYRNHRVVLDYSSPGMREWLEMFHVGDVLQIYGRAQYPGWTNHIEYVELDVYYA